MKICFPVEINNGLNSEIYGHFGSAPGFVTYDTETKESGYIDNKNAVHEHGACNPAAALAGSGVNAVVVGGIGQGAMMRLMSEGVAVYQAKSGRVKEDIDGFSGLIKLSRDMQTCGGGAHVCGGH
ncbi:MAG: NifB/NifX family molybdenum-iron cluster-binding protein [Deferribacterales bacterium]